MLVSRSRLTLPSTADSIFHGSSLEPSSEYADFEPLSRHSTPKPEIRHNIDLFNDGISFTEPAIDPRLLVNTVAPEASPINTRQTISPNNQHTGDVSFYVRTKSNPETIRTTATTSPSLTRNTDPLSSLSSGQKRQGTSPPSSCAYSYSKKGKHDDG